MSIVVDPGAWSFKCGLAGDGKPRVVIPSFTGKISLDGDCSAAGHGEKMTSSGLRVDRAALAEYDPDVELRSTILRGKIVNWESFEALMRYTEAKLMKEGNNGEKRCLYVEGHEQDEKDREKLSEILFEKLSYNSAFMAKSAPLNVFACARVSAVVLDVGHDLAVASTVIDGALLKQTVHSSPLAGGLLQSELLNRLESPAYNIIISPRFSFKKKFDRNGNPLVERVNAPCHKSFSRFWKLDIIDKMLRELGVVSSKQVNHSNKNKSCSTQKESQENGISMEIEEDQRSNVKQNDEYILPDGTVVKGSKELGCNVADLLFNPVGCTVMDVPNNLLDLVTQSLNALRNTEVKRDLMSSVVLAGGPTAITGFENRFGDELSAWARAQKSRYIVSGPEERTVNAWVGGSIVGSLPTLSDLWVSVEDYREHGAKIVSEKCP